MQQLCAVLPSVNHKPDGLSMDKDLHKECAKSLIIIVEPENAYLPISNSFKPINEESILYSRYTLVISATNQSLCILLLLLLHSIIQVATPIL